MTTPTFALAASSFAAAHRALLEAQSSKVCTTAFLEFLAPLGFKTFSCGEVDLRDRDRAVFFAVEWPDEWRKFYFGSGLIERDPIVTCLPLYALPVTWSEMRRDGHLSHAGAEALRLCAEHGWSEGLVVPIPRGASRYGLVSLVGSRPPLSDREKSLVSLVALAAHTRLGQLARRDGFPLPPAGLTSREVECLRLISRGNTDREIGAALEIAPTTARDYFESARRKLGAGSRPEAAALAVSLGIIDP